MPVAWHSNPEIKSPSLFSLCLLKPYMCVYVLHKRLLSADKFLAFHSLTVLEGRCINLHIAQLTVCTRDRLALCQTRSMPCISPASHTYSFIQSNPMRRETYYPSSARNFRHGLSQPVPGYTAFKWWSQDLHLAAKLLSSKLNHSARMERRRRYDGHINEGSLGDKKKYPKERENLSQFFQNKIYE